MSPARRVRRIWPLLVAVTLAGVLFLGVFPTRTFLAQRASLQRASEQKRVLGEENRLLAERIDRLRTDAEIERLAREQYNLVRPGEQAYALLPPPPAPIDLPDGWPFDALQQTLQPGPAG